MRLGPPIWNHQELTALQTGVIVESWPRRKDGAVRRAYEKTFTEAERCDIEQLYHLINGWHGKGIPQEAALTIYAYQLLQQAANFFAGV